jgi:hypothetical protein
VVARRPLIGRRWPASSCPAHGRAGEAPATGGDRLQRQDAMAAAGCLGGGPVRAEPHRAMLEQLQDADALDRSRAALESASPPTERGAATGPNPTGSGKPGTRRPRVVDAQGHAARTEAERILLPRQPHAGRHARRGPGLWIGRPSRPRRGPDKLPADQDYDRRRRRSECRVRGFTARIDRYGTERRERLDRHRAGS